MTDQLNPEQTSGPPTAVTAAQALNDMPPTYYNAPPAGQFFPQPVHGATVETDQVGVLPW